MPGAEHRIEVIRGDLEGGIGDEILAFWEANEALQGEAATARLTEVVCVARDEVGAITGVSSTFADQVPPVGNRAFWIYRSFLLPEAEDAAEELIRATYRALAEGFDPRGGEPIGLCVLLAGREEMERSPDAEWADPRMFYAGYLGDGRQIRIAYFEGAAIGPGDFGVMTTDELAPGYRITRFADTPEVTEQNVIDLWAREGAVSGDEAKRRISEVHLVATHESGTLVGISSAYLQVNEQLRMPLFYYRSFVSEAHRSANAAVQLAMRGRDDLKERYTSGRDTRAAGVIYEVENPGLKRYFNFALWLPTDFLFIGENARGDHVRVHWFPGAKAPLI